MKQYIKQHKTYLLASFFIPVAIMALVYLLNGIYPGSDRSILASDAFAQFSNFHASFRQVLLGKQSIFCAAAVATGKFSRRAECIPLYIGKSLING